MFVPGAPTDEEEAMRAARGTPNFECSDLEGFMVGSSSVALDVSFELRRLTDGRNSLEVLFA